MCAACARAPAAPCRLFAAQWPVRRHERLGRSRTLASALAKSVGARGDSQAVGFLLGAGRHSLTPASHGVLASSSLRRRFLEPSRHFAAFAARAGQCRAARPTTTGAVGARHSRLSRPSGAVPGAQTRFEALPTVPTVPDWLRAVRTPANRLPIIVRRREPSAAAARPRPSSLSQKRLETCKKAAHDARPAMPAADVYPAKTVLCACRAPASP